MRRCNAQPYSMLALGIRTRRQPGLYHEVEMRPRTRNVGLARALSKLGYCSRSQAFELVRAGHVQVNGQSRRDPESPVGLERDRITVDGKPIAIAEKIYLMLNKPRGVVTSASDEKGRNTVFSFLPAGMSHLGAVGRLDMASEGLLLFTNDSEWAARVTEPEGHVEKTYHVQIDRVADDDLLKQLRKGVRAEDGEVLRVKRTEVLRSGKRNSWIAITLDEGKNRHIRRMMEGLGVVTLRLLRVAIGDLALGDLAKGKCRALTVEEKRTLDKALPPARPLPTRRK